MSLLALIDLALCPRWGDGTGLLALGGEALDLMGLFWFVGA